MDRYKSNLDPVKEGNNNVYKASFAPFETGTYEYRMAFSSDLGKHWIYSDKTNKVNLTQGEDTTAPASALNLKQPIKELGQVNLDWSVENQADDAYMITISVTVKLLRKSMI